jgi:hypothetical protein
MADLTDPCVPLCPWAKSEMTAREMLNVARPTAVVIPMAGEGEDLLAAIRDKITATAFFRNTKHMNIVLEHMKSVIVSEVLDSVDDGFLEKRHLKRMRSVGGMTHASTGSDRKRRKKHNSSNSSSSSRSSSGGSDDGPDKEATEAAAAAAAAAAARRQEAEDNAEPPLKKTK